MTRYHIRKLPLVGRADGSAETVGKLHGLKIFGGTNDSFNGTRSTDVWTSQAIGALHQAPVELPHRERLSFKALSAVKGRVK
jgi:hypothetical protein